MGEGCEAEHTLIPAALADASLAEVAGMDGMSVDVEVAGPGSCFEPRNRFLDFKNFL